MPLSSLLAQFFAPFTCLPFDDLAAQRYAVIRAELERTGTPIGAYGLLIAATALAHDLVLVSHHTGESRRVAGLRVEDWETE